MHQITKKALSPDAQVENCVRGILDAFNQDPENFKETTLPQPRNETNATTNVTTTITDPWEPCKSEVELIEVDLVAVSNRDVLVTVLVTNIKDRFKCLYYSYRNSVLSESQEIMAADQGKLLEVGDGSSFCGVTCIQGASSSCSQWEVKFPLKPLFETLTEDEIWGGAPRKSALFHLL